jgi:hypothetical protein
MLRSNVQKSDHSATQQCQQVYSLERALMQLSAASACANGKKLFWDPEVTF